MKFRLFLLTMLTIMFMPMIMFGQDLPPEVTIPTDPNEWFSFDRVEWLYGVLVVVGGYLSAFIPGLKSISVGVYRVLTWGILTGLGFILLGAPIWGVAITYFLSTGLYDIVLKLIIRSPRPRDQNGREKSGKIEPLIG